jgi:hypothetical protein
MIKKYRVVVAIIQGDETIYATLSHRDKIEFCKRTALKYAAEYKAKHLRDTWVEES